AEVRARDEDRGVDVVGQAIGPSLDPDAPVDERLVRSLYGCAARSSAQGAEAENDEKRGDEKYEELGACTAHGGPCRPIRSAAAQDSPVAPHQRLHVRDARTGARNASQRTRSDPSVRSIAGAFSVMSASGPPASATKRRSPATNRRTRYVNAWSPSTWRNASSAPRVPSSDATSRVPVSA